MNTNEKHPLLVILGWITLVINVMTMGIFIGRRQVFQYLSEHWAISLFFLFILLVVGLSLLYLGGSMKSLLIWGGLLGIVSFFISITIYALLGVVQVFGDMQARKFIGATTLFLLSFSIWLTFFQVAHAKVPDNYRGLLKLPSYGYATVTLVLIFSLVWKYVIMSVGIDLSIIIETMIVAIGAGIFMYLHTQTKSDHTDA